MRGAGVDTGAAGVVVEAVVVDGVAEGGVVLALGGVPGAGVVELGVVLGVEDDGPVIAVDVVDGGVVPEGVVVPGDGVVEGGVVLADVAGVPAVVDGLAFLSASLILPQMSCAVSFGSVLAGVSPGFVAAAVLAGGVVVDAGGVAVVVAVVVGVLAGVVVVAVAAGGVVAVGLAPLLDSSSLSLFCRSAISDCFMVSRR